MKLRTRLPRASTTASVAALTPHEQFSAACNTQNDPGMTKQQCTQILQQLESFDTEGVFTGELTLDGRLAADGPPLTYNLRYHNVVMLVLLCDTMHWCSVIWGPA